MNKLSIALLAVLLSLAAYAGGTANLVYSTKIAPPSGPTITLNNLTIGNNDNQQVSLTFENNFAGACGGACGGMMETADNFTWTGVNNNWLNNWQAGGFMNCIGQSYEIRWNQVSGTLTDPPFGSSTLFPEDQWSFSEFVDAMRLCDIGFGWFGGVWPGPIFSQGAAAANTVIEISIRRIDLTGPTVTATFTFTP